MNKLIKLTILATLLMLTTSSYLRKEDNKDNREEKNSLLDKK